MDDAGGFYALEEGLEPERDGAASPPLGGGEVRVAHAESGRAISLDAAPSDSVLGLKAALATLTGVDAGYQILLLDGERLENDASIGEYGLPAATPVGARARPVFLFDRRSLNREGPLPEPPALSPAELVVPDALPDELVPKRPANLPSPLVRALVDYERHFTLHLLQANAIGKRPIHLHTASSTHKHGHCSHCPALTVRRPHRHGTRRLLQAVL
jgi:hypothetical protein